MVTNDLGFSSSSTLPVFLDCFHFFIQNLTTSMMKLINVKISTRTYITVNITIKAIPISSLGDDASSMIVMIAIRTKESSSNQLAICLKIDSNTLRKLSIKEIPTRTKNKIAYAREGIISVRQMTMASKSLMMMNYV